MVEWKNPPEPKTSRAKRVAAELKNNPGMWARIETNTSVVLAPWWLPLDKADDFEVRYHYSNSGGFFGPKDVYARYIGG